MPPKRSVNFDEKINKIIKYSDLDGDDGGRDDNNNNLSNNINNTGGNILDPIDKNDHSENSVEKKATVFSGAKKKSILKLNRQNLPIHIFRRRSSSPPPPPPPLSLPSSYITTATTAAPALVSFSSLICSKCKNYNKFIIKCNCHKSNFCKQCLIVDCLAKIPEINNKEAEWFCKESNEYIIIQMKKNTDIFHEEIIFEREKDEICNQCKKIILCADVNGYNCICCEGKVYCQLCFDQRRTHLINKNKNISIIESIVKKRKKTLPIIKYNDDDDNNGNTTIASLVDQIRQEEEEQQRYEYQKNNPIVIPTAKSILSFSSEGRFVCFNNNNNNNNNGKENDCDVNDLKIDKCYIVQPVEDEIEIETMS